MEDRKRTSSRAQDSFISSTPPRRKKRLRKISPSLVITRLTTRSSTEKEQREEHDTDNSSNAFTNGDTVTMITTDHLNPTDNLALTVLNSDHSLQGGDLPDTANDELGPLVPSTKAEKLRRRLARQKQLEEMKGIEQSDNRKQRYLKRQKNFDEGEGEEDTDSSLDKFTSSPKKQVRWEEKIEYHSYTPEPLPSTS